jgi:hypothetical protein
MNARWIALAVTGALLAGLLTYEYPSLRRYLKIERM